MLIILVKHSLYILCHHFHTNHHRQFKLSITPFGFQVSHRSRLALGINWLPNRICYTVLLISRLCACDFAVMWVNNLTIRYYRPYFIGIFTGAIIMTSLVLKGGFGDHTLATHRLPLIFSMDDITFETRLHENPC